MALQLPRLHVVTSFFVVRALAGAFSPFGGPLASSPASFNNPSLSSHNNSPQFLSQVSGAVIDLTRRRVGSRKDEKGSNQDPAVAAAAERQLEYLHCLLMNLHSPAVHRLLLLVQDPASAELLSTVMSQLPAFAMQRDKLVPILFQPRWHQQQQPHYRDLFAIARQLLHPTRDIAAVCNSDIHFNTKQLAGVAAAEIQDAVSPGTVLGLTRYEECGEQDSFFSGGGGMAMMDVPTSLWWQQPAHFDPVDVSHAPLIDDYRGSHDAFVFRPASISDRFLSAVDHPQNAYQSENIVVHEFENEMKGGGGVAQLRNPSKHFFRIAHRHASDVRQWFPPVDGGGGTDQPEGKGAVKRYGRIVPE